jgi:hypothetical protein
MGQKGHEMAEDDRKQHHRVSCQPLTILHLV